MSLLEWLFTNQQSLPDGVYNTDKFGNVFCSGMLIGSDVKPTISMYFKIDKRIKKL